MHWLPLLTIAVLGAAAAAQDKSYSVGFSVDGKPVILETKDGKVRVLRDGKELEARYYKVEDDGRVYRFHDDEGEDAAVVELDDEGARVRTYTALSKTPRLGVDLGPVDEALAEVLGVDVDEALKVEGLTEGFPAQKAGVRRNDVLVSVDGRGPVTMERVQEVLGKKKWGDSISLEVARKSGTKKIDVQLTRPKNVRGQYGSLQQDYVTGFRGLGQGLFQKDDLARALSQLQKADRVLDSLDLEDVLQKAADGWKSRYKAEDMEALQDLLRKTQGDYEQKIKTALDQAKVSLKGLEGLQGFDWKPYVLQVPGEGWDHTDRKTTTRSGGDTAAKLTEVEKRIERIEKKLDQVLKGLEKND